MRPINNSAASAFEYDFREALQTALERGLQCGLQHLRENRWPRVYEDRWLRGWASGWAEGWVKGYREGAAAKLLGMIEEKFGPTSDGVRESIEAADVQTLLHWSKRMHIAESIEDLWT
jgi:hypothetical protein